MEEKKIGKRTLLKSGLWYTFSMFLTRAMIFVSMPFFTRVMSEEDYGDFSVFATWQTILFIICSLELSGTLNRARFDYTDKKDFHAYITSCLYLNTIITGVLFIAYLVFPHVFDRFFLLDRKYIYVMFAYLFAEPASFMFVTKQRIEYKYKISSAISITVAVFSPLIAIFLVLMMRDHDPLFGRIIGQNILYILFGIVFFAYFLSKSTKLSVKYWKYAMRLGLPLVISYLGSRILLSSDNIVLKQMCSATQVSYLSVTHTCSQIALLLVQTLNSAWSPWFYDMLKRDNYKSIKNIYEKYIWLVILLTAMVLLIGPEVIMILGGSKYRASVYILPPTILCGVFTVFTAQFVDLETYHKKPEYAAFITGGVAVLNVILNILGVKLWGYQAVCYTTVVCQIVLIAAHYLITQRMRAKDILSFNVLVKTLSAALMLIPISLLLYQNDIVRYIFIAVIFSATVILAVRKREDIKMIVNRIVKQKKES